MNVRNLVMGFLALTVFAAQVTASDKPGLSRENVSAFFDTAFSVQQKNHELVGVVVSVVHEGEVLFKAGYGFADLGERIPADPDDSLFRIASITKPFVWTAIMQLVEQGQLSLDDSIDEYIDYGIPETYEEPIRVWHLLTHTPGFEERGIGGTIKLAEDVPSLGEYLAENIPARVRPPGEQASYSNYGSAIAGYIVERISGQSWSDYVDRHILTPLGMTSTNTQMVMSDALKARHAKGYRYQAGQFEASDYEYFMGLPAGHISTTASDMTRFMRAFLNDGSFENGRILRPETTQQMFQPLFEPHDGISPMLHGFYRADRQGLEVFGHGGDVNQFHSNLSLIPAHDLGLFVSFNSDPGAGARSRLVAAFIDHFFGSDYLRTAPEPADIDLEPYAGEYLSLRRNQSTFEKLGSIVNVVSVSAQEKELLVSGGGVSRWIPVARNTFTAKYADQTLAFQRNADDEVTHMVIGSPLSTLDRVSGLDAPGNQRLLIGFLLVTALIAVIGYGVRARYRARQEVRLPRSDVAVAWVFSLLVIVLYAYLIITLNSDVQEFSYGVPTTAHILMLLMCLNVVLGLVVVFFSARHWMTGAGELFSRIRFSIVGLAALTNLWVGWYFNILSYPFL